MTCTFMAGCPMYPTVSSVAELSFWLERYCRGEPLRCERLQRLLTGESAPEPPVETRTAPVLRRACEG